VNLESSEMVNEIKVGNRYMNEVRKRHRSECNDLPQNYKDPV